MTTFFDGDGFRWDFVSALGGYILDGTRDAYDGGNRLQINGAYPNGTFGSLELNGRQDVFSGDLNQIHFERRLYVPTASGEGWARFLESFTNTAATTQTFTVTLYTNSGADNNFRFVATSSGDLSLTTADRYYVGDDSDTPTGFDDPAVLELYSDGRLAPTSLSSSGDVTTYTFTLTLAPGETQSILHFASQQNDLAGINSELPTLATPDAVALAGLTAAQIASVQNFNLAAPVVVAPFDPTAPQYLVSNGIDPTTLSGALGNDTYVVSNPRTAIVDGPNGGNDTVFVSTQFGLTTFALSGGAFIETLSAADQQGTDPLNLTGNFYSQTLVGNFGNNLLNGNGGADTLIGLRGDDTYAISDASAVIVENPGEGYDRVYTSVSYTLTGTASVEELGFTNQSSTENLNLIGNAFDQKIVGNYGDNVLNGNGGVDTLIGLLGNDTYVVGDSRTVVIENAGEGFDTVFANTSYTLAAGSSIELLSTATQGGTEAYDLTGNGFAQAVIGNNGVNVIDGGAGADTLTGLGGADTFRFSTALGGGNVDAITDFGNGADRISLASGIFTGMAQGTLSASNFVNGTAATTADQHIVYNQATGQLFFDADGSGAGAAVLFATVTPNTIVTASMITVA